MNKKRISVVMATAMAASMAAVPMTASADDTVELTFMGWEASPLETQAVQDGIAKFEEQYPNIKVNYTPGLSRIRIQCEASVFRSSRISSGRYVCSGRELPEYGSQGCTAGYHR